MSTGDQSLPDPQDDADLVDGKSDSERPVQLLAEPLPAPGQPVKPPRRGEWPRSLFTRGVFAAFAFQNYRYLWTGTVVTSTGQWMQQVAMGWLVLELTNSPAFLGFVGFARGLPMLFLALPAGVAADRFSRRTLLMIFQSIGASIAVVLALIVAFDIVKPWHLVLISVLMGSVMAFIGPSRQSLVPNVVDRESIANAVALNSAGQNSTRIIGPSLAGVLISLVGIAICFVFQAVGFLSAVFMTFRLRIKPSVRKPTKTSLTDNLLGGIRYIRQDSVLSGLLLMAAVPTVMAMPYMSMLPVFARDVWDTGSSGLGILMAVSGFGALVGSMIFAAWGNRVEHQGRLLVGTATMFGLVLVVFAISPWFWLGLPLVAIVSGTSAIYMSANNTVLQLTVSDEYRGRVMAVYLMTFGLMPFGTLPMGAMASAVGAPVAVATQALLGTAIVLLVALRLPKLRNMVRVQSPA